jgi:hypothetical protein
MNLPSIHSTRPSPHAMPDASHPACLIPEALFQQTLCTPTLVDHAGVETKVGSSAANFWFLGVNRSEVIESIMV